jgi:uncharacterized protein (DUF2062 family)
VLSLISSSLRRFSFYLRKLWLDEKEFYGLVIGVFFGFLPIHGIQMATAAAVAKFFRKSPVAAIVGTHVTNWWTTIPILFINYKIGNFVLQTLNIKITQSVVLCTTATFIGGLLLGILSSCLLIIVRNATVNHATI